MVEFCYSCTKPTPKFRCSACKNAQYCSTECQKLDWSNHKNICKRSVNINPSEITSARDSSLKETEILDKFKDNFNQLNDSEILDQSLLNQLQDLFIKNGKHHLFSKFKNTRLVYRGAKHGQFVETFHKKCDGVPYTLSILSTKPGGYIFGGFTRGKWNLLDMFVRDEEAFIFSLVNRDKKPLIMNCIEPDFAIASNGSSAQCFGTGSDISVYHNFDHYSPGPIPGFLCYARIGHNYKFDLYPVDSDEADTFIGGAKNFYIKEMEVYQFY